MKKIICFGVLCILAANSIAQSVSESKDNVNSILLNGSAITLKITDPALKLDFQRNNLFKKSRNNGYLIGVSAEGKNQNGTAAVFDGGELVPSGRINGLFGLTFSNNVITKFEDRKKEIKGKERAIRNKLDELTARKEQLKESGKDTEEVNKEIKKVTENELKPVLDMGAALREEISNAPFYKLSIFGYGGLSAKSFKRFIGYDLVNPMKSFKNENFQGGFYGLGVNYQYRIWQFGATVGYRKDDNQALLPEMKYNYEKVTTVNNETIKEAKEIKAFAGNYGVVSYTSFNFDIVGNFSLDEVKSMAQPRNYMLVNAYLQSKSGSSNTDLMPNTINLGLGLYLLNSKSKILGGIYLELPDVGDQIEKSKVASDRQIRSALQKLSFGIVTRFNLQSFVKFQNL